MAEEASSPRTESGEEQAAWIACYEHEGAGCASGIADARRLDVRAKRRDVHGWVAISSTLLNLSDWDVWLRDIDPVGTIGGTILLYHLP